MCTAAAEVASGTAHDQLKLAIMAGIVRRLDVLRARHTSWARVADELDWHPEHLARLRMSQAAYFSFPRLIDMATQLGVELNLKVD